MAHGYDATMPVELAHTGHHSVSGRKGARSRYVLSNFGMGLVRDRRLNPQHGTLEDSANNSYVLLKTRVVGELMHFHGGIDTTKDVDSWPISVVNRWKTLNGHKSSSELGILSWNTNGRLDFRGCRESLLKRWSMKGFVDVGLIQEHFKKSGTPLFDLFGPAWRNISSGAVGESKGRRSGGCAIFGQPCLVTGQGFQDGSGRICGLYASGGLILSVYFPTRRPKQLMDQYRCMVRTFVDDLIMVVSKLILKQKGSWIACGADLNAHFKGCGLPPRRKGFCR